MSETYSIGVDLGGTNLRVAAYGGSNGFLETIVLPTRLTAGRDQVVKDMCEAITTLISRDYGDRRLAGIVVGTPGPLELPAGILRKPPNLQGWNGACVFGREDSTLNGNKAGFPGGTAAHAED